MVAAGMGSLNAATMSRRGVVEHPGQVLVDDLLDRRLQLGQRGRAEVGLDHPAVPGVVGRIGGGEHVDRVAVVRDPVRDGAAVAVVVEHEDDVGREVVGAAHGLLDEPGVGHHVGVLPRDLPDRRLTSQLVVQRLRVVEHVGPQQQAGVAQVVGHGVSSLGLPSARPGCAASPLPRSWSRHRCRRGTGGRRPSAERSRGSSGQPGGGQRPRRADGDHRHRRGRGRPRPGRARCRCRPRRRSSASAAGAASG